MDARIASLVDILRLNTRLFRNCLDGFTVSHALRDRLDELPAAELEAIVSPRFPMPNPTRLSALTFLVQHDSYHIGQLALLRRHAGLPAMCYR